MRLLYDDLFEWEGWGGHLKLASGRCRLLLCDLGRDRRGAVRLKPLVAVAREISDAPRVAGRLAIRSCAGHIATEICRRFAVAPQKLLYVEYYPPSRYGHRGQFTVAERFEAARFQWHGTRAMNPKWFPLEERLVEALKPLVAKSDGPE
jgi:hypothetical protein